MRRARRPSWQLAGFVVAVAACSPFDPDLSSAPFLCGPQNPPCPDGFTCKTEGNQSVCLDDSGSGSDTVFICVDEGVFTSTTSIATAFQTPVGSGRASITYGPLSICPAGAKNTFAVDVTTAGQSLDASVTYQADGDPLTLVLLDGSGNVDATGSAAGNDTIAASATEAAAGTFYVQVAGPATPGPANGENNYNVSISVTGP